MTSPLQSHAATAPVDETVDAESAAAASAAPVPPDLLTVNAVPADITAMPGVHGNAPAAPAARPGPRLDRVPTVAIRPAETMPRRRLEASDLEALATSIKHNGLAQPLLVRLNPGRPGIYELFAGYRRWRAALAAEVAYVPAIVFEGLGEAVALELGVLENLHRRDLTVIEEAEALRTLIDQFGRTHEQVAMLTGRSRSQVTNLLRLLSLPDEVKDKLHSGDISFGHGRALLGAAMPGALARRIVAERLTVRETELLAAQLQGMRPLGQAFPASMEIRTAHGLPAPASVPGEAEIKSLSDLRQLQAELAEAMGTGLDVCTAEGGAALMIRSPSARDTAAVVSILRDALKLLRVNRAIDVLSQDLRAV